MDLQQIKEEYCIKNGWEKVKEGYKIDVEKTFSDGFDSIFVTKEMVHKVDYWRDKEGDNEYCFDDIDSLIGEIDDWKEENEETFEQYLKRMEETSHK